MKKIYLVASLCGKVSKYVIYKTKERLSSIVVTMVQNAMESKAEY